MESYAWQLPLGVCLLVDSTCLLCFLSSSRRPGDMSGLMYLADLIWTVTLSGTTDGSLCIKLSYWHMLWASFFLDGRGLYASSWIAMFLNLIMH